MTAPAGPEAAAAPTGRDVEDRCAKENAALATTEVRGSNYL